MNNAHITRKRMEYVSQAMIVISLYLYRFVLDIAGIGYFVTMMALYELLWILFGSGCIDTIGRMLRSRFTKGQSADAKTAWNTILMQQTLLGVLGAGTLGYAGMRLAQGFFAMPHAATIGWFLAPAFLLRMLSSAFAGYCSGKGSEGPAGISAILRGAFFPAFGFLFLGVLRGYGEKVSALLLENDFSAMYGCIGLGVAMIVSELFVLVFVLIVSAGASHSSYPEKNDYLKSRETSGAVLHAFWSRRLIDLVNGFIFAAPFIIAIFLLTSRGAEDTVTNSGALIGNLFISYLGLWFLVGLIGLFLLLPVAIRTFSAMKKEERRASRGLLQTLFHWSVVIGGFAMAFFAAMSEPIAALIGTAEEGALEKALLIGAFPALLLPIILGLYQILLLNGFGIYTAGGAFLAGAGSLACLAAFLGSGQNRILSMVLALLIWCAVMTVAMVILSYWKLGLTPDLVRSILMPILAGAVLGLLTLLLAGAIAPHLGSAFTILICFAMMLLLYNMLLLVLRNFTDREVRVLPGGKLLEALGHLLRVM